MSQAPVELSDAAIEAAREPLSTTLAFLDGLQAICVQNMQALPSIGGNVLIHVRGVGAWTLVTQGPINGLFAEATDDDVAFALSCEEWVLHELLDPDADVDLKRYKKAKFFRWTGDFAVFSRLLGLATGGVGKAATTR
jgi:hypothetical protein